MRGSDYMANEEKSFQKSSINWYPGHMAKAKREIKEKLNLIDIVYEVIDARMPLSSKIKDINDLIKDKPRILIMTKYDLCDKEKTASFITYYENKGYKVVPVDLMNNNVKQILELSDEVSKDLNNKRKLKGLKPRNLRALIIGIPNVGKSTLINRIVSKKVAGVGNKPGVTKGLNFFRVNKNIELLDTPGILWPKLEDQDQAKILAIFSSIKEEILNKEELALDAIKILRDLYKEKLENRYNISISPELTDLDVLELIANKRGALEKGGLISYEKAANIVLNDIKNNAFKDITLDRLN